MKNMGSTIQKLVYLILGVFIGATCVTKIVDKNPMSQERLAYLQGCSLGQAHLLRKNISKGVDPVFCLKQSEVFSESLQDIGSQMDLIISNRKPPVFL